MQKRCLQGDLDQMYRQKDFLEREGYCVSMDGGIPVIDSVDYERAIRDIYEKSVAGWWNYREELLLAQICTAEEFAEKLRR